MKKRVTHILCMCTVCSSPFVREVAVFTVYLWFKCNSNLFSVFFHLFCISTVCLLHLSDAQPGTFTVNTVFFIVLFTMVYEMSYHHWYSTIPIYIFQLLSISSLKLHWNKQINQTSNYTAKNWSNCNALFWKKKTKRRNMKTAN